MMINVVDIKKRIGRIIDDRYDHKFLNSDTPPFDMTIPTPENLSRQLLAEAGPLFEDSSATPVACHLRDSFRSAATAYADGRVERDLWLEFSAARRTHSPNLSDDENEALFGIAASKSGHGHNYRLRVTLAGEVDRDSGLIAPAGQTVGSLEEIRKEFDHKNINVEVPGMQDLPITTESLARYIWKKLAADLPVNRVKLYELPGFFSEYTGDEQCLLGVNSRFHAAHRLHSPALSDEENLKIYGKCNNPGGHGHEYKVEATIGGEYNAVVGAIYDFAAFAGALKKSIEPWSYRHLDLDTDDFKESPSTGENIVACLWPRLDDSLDNKLHRLRLWETRNNRFTMRRQTNGGQ
jgi:6-pyruvoyltetrahydropterin/6-carboxytetrahydropterin synthase